MRIVAAYLASHPDTPQLMLDPAPGAAALMGLLADAVPGTLDQAPDREGRIDTLDREVDVLPS